MSTEFCYLNPLVFLLILLLINILGLNEVSNKEF